MHHRKSLVLTVALAALLTVSAACERQPARAARDNSSESPQQSGALRFTMVDDFGDTLALRAAPRRIVSLNPATTELFFALGAGDRLVGRTQFDMYPAAAVAVPDLGNAMQPNVEAVLGARPDLVLLYASNMNRDAATRFHAAGVATLTLRGDRIADFRRTVTVLGRIIDDTLTAKVVVDSVSRTLEAVRAATASLPRPTTFWKAWDSPVIAIGGGSFLTELLEIAGGRNIYGDDPRPSLDVTIEDVVRRDPDIVVAGPESSVRMRAQPAWRALRAVRDGHIVVFDTMLVGRPGVRLGEAAVSIARLLHPGSIP